VSDALTMALLTCKQYHFCEVDWAIPMTYAQSREYLVDATLNSDSFTCGGSSFQLELTPNSSSHGLALRLVSVGPIFCFRIHTAEAQILLKGEAGLAKTRGRKWPTAAAGRPDTHVDLRDVRVGWAPLISQTDFETKEITHFVGADGLLRIRLELYIHAEVAETGSSTGHPLGQDLLSFRREEKAVDAHFVLADGSRVGFHKAIVCARSPYMFNLIYNERFSRTGGDLFDAAEFEPVAFVAFLHLLYTDDVQQLTNLSVENVLEVLRIGDMYGTATVVSACDTCLAHGEMLNVSTCGLLLGIAYKFSRESLKSAALDFFKRNRAAVVNTPSFHQCITENADLGIELWKSW